jgi:hypothetical protein
MATNGEFQSGRLLNATPLLMATAMLEVGAAVGLLAAPAAVVRLLFGPDVELFPVVGVARLTGAALLALGAACWWGRQLPRAARALVGGALVYNAAVVILLITGALGALGPLLGAVVALHGGLTIWCLLVVASAEPSL